MKFFIVVLFPLALLATSDVNQFAREQQQEIAEFVSEQEHGIAQLERSNRSALAKTAQEFAAWQREQQLELENFRRDIRKKWGMYQEQTPHRWVEYGEDLNSVVVAEFDSGLVHIEALRFPSESDSAVGYRLRDAVRRALTSRGVRSNVPRSSPDSAVPISEQRILADQVTDAQGKVVADAQIDQFADSVAATAKAQRTPLVQLTLPLAPDHVRRRAEPFLPLIEEFCLKYDLDRALVLATIQTESNFNPAARSSANAIGLMQLVPGRGARDAYRFVYNEDRIPLPDYLLDSRNNIELGCAYLFLLKTAHFGPIKDSKSRLYCSIAAYNTGPANVARVFNDKRRLRDAISEINATAGSGEIYRRLCRDLPYVETRLYLKKVVETMPLYQQN